jgi:hypothetical protein
MTNSAMYKHDPAAPKKTIYGRKKSCLKDIAAHFDEKDIFEAKKQSLIQQQERATSLQEAQAIAKKLKNLESWHAMMQKKFMQSEAESKAAEKRLWNLFEAHLPAELFGQLKSNKEAERSALPIPFPKAKAQAMKLLRSKRNEIRRDQKLKKLGFKKFIRPNITNPEFPSMDPISTHLRGQLWRRIATDGKWSTDNFELEKGDKLEKAAFQQHSDFVEGPIAKPLLKGKLYEPETEALGVPNFLTNFLWPKEPEKEITMDDKMKVEQTDFSHY